MHPIVALLDFPSVALLGNLWEPCNPNQKLDQNPEVADAAVCGGSQNLNHLCCSIMDRPEAPLGLSPVCNVAVRGGVAYVPCRTAGTCTTSVRATPKKNPFPCHELEPWCRESLNQGTREFLNLFRANLLLFILLDLQSQRKANQTASQILFRLYKTYHSGGTGERNLVLSNLQNPHVVQDAVAGVSQQWFQSLCVCRRIALFLSVWTEVIFLVRCVFAVCRNQAML